MGALMPIYETLKLWWSVRIIISKNNWFAILVPDGHARCHASAPFTAVNETDIFAFVIGAFGWLNNCILLSSTWLNCRYEANH
jgi:hypothetical protein